MFWWAREVLRLLREILYELHRINHRHAVSVRIVFKENGMAASVTLNVGQSVVATVIVLDQFGNPITNFDFGANPPVWGVDDTAAVSLAAGGAPNEENVGGVAPTAGAATLTVSVPGVANGVDQAAVTVVAVVQPPVPTSVSISFSTPTP